MVASSRQDCCKVRKIIAEFVAPNIQQGANDQAGHGIDACKSRRTGAAQQMSQNRLGLVIRRMRDGHAAQATRSGGRSKKLITQTPRGVFEIPAVASRLAGHIGAVRNEFEAKLPRKPGNETFVFVRFRSAKLMVEMQDENPDSKL